MGLERRLDDDAAEVEAEDLGKLGYGGSKSLPGPRLGIDRVHTGGDHPHKHLAQDGGGHRDGGLGQDAGSAPLRDSDRTHHFGDLREFGGECPGFGGWA